MSDNNKIKKYQTHIKEKGTSMKNILKGLFTSALVMALAIAYAAPVSAQSATQNSDITVNCNAVSGSYGQSTNNCYAMSNQTIQQNRLSNRNILLTQHVPINTAVDPSTMIAAMGALVTTSTGAVITFKKMRQ